jgi:tetratricopeptide (TPR) repeat protein
MFLARHRAALQRDDIDANRYRNGWLTQLGHATYFVCRGLLMVLAIPEAMLKWFGRLLILAAAVLIVVSACTALTEDVIVLDPISVPKELEDRGITATFVAQRLLDETRRIEDNATTAKARTYLRGESKVSPLANVQLPASGLSVDSLVSILRNLLMLKDMHIGAEVSAMPADAFGPLTNTVVVVHVSHGDSRFSKRLDKDDLDSQIRTAAIEVMRHIDPVALASHFRSQEAWSNMAEVIDYMLSNRAQPKRHRLPNASSEIAWARNLYGILLAQRDKDHDAAMHVFEEVLRDYPDFAPARSNIGVALYFQGRWKEAVATFRAIVKSNPEYYVVFENWGEVLQECARHDEAVAKFKQSLEINPAYAAARKNLAVSLAHMGKYEQAAEQYRIASRLPPVDRHNLEGCWKAVSEAPNTPRALPACEHLHQATARLVGSQLAPNKDCPNL